jgi:hypothetical protein
MPNPVGNPKTPSQKAPAKGSETTEDKKLDRIADDAAKRAGKTEKRYDEDHDIFTK